MGLPSRIYHTTRRKTGPYHDSSLADNVLIKECTGDMLLHLDDDGFVNHRLIEFLQQLESFQALNEGVVYYGNNVFVDMEDLRIIGRDPRHEQLKCDVTQAVSLPITHCAGAMYLAPVNILRKIGGHDMQYIGWRGCDSRLGVRLHKEAQCWFMGLPQMSFYHFGKSKYREMIDSGLPHTFDEWKSPGYGLDSWEHIANGGEEFWKNGLKGWYEEA